MFLMMVFIVLTAYGIAVGLYLAKAFVRSDVKVKTICRLLLLHAAVNMVLMAGLWLGWIPDARSKGYGLHTLNLVFLIGVGCGGARIVADWLLGKVFDRLGKK